MLSAVKLPITNCPRPPTASVVLGSRDTVFVTVASKLNGGAVVSFGRVNLDAPKIGAIANLLTADLGTGLLPNSRDQFRNRIACCGIVAAQLLNN